MDGEPWDPKSSLEDPMKLKGSIASCAVRLKPRLGQCLHSENQNIYERERERAGQLSGLKTIAPGHEGGQKMQIKKDKIQKYGPENYHVLFIFFFSFFMNENEMMMTTRRNLYEMKVGHAIPLIFKLITFISYG